MTVSLEDITDEWRRIPPALRYKLHYHSKELGRIVHRLQKRTLCGSGNVWALESTRDNFHREKYAEIDHG